MATRGTTSPTTTRGPARTTGARTGWPVISDDEQRVCFAIALWNGRDPILKERLFGLTNAEGNHGEDVKEYYFYLDSTPTHSYMKWLYKYPQRPYPYDDLVKTNRQRSRNEFEYELLDTGVFADDKYFDVEVEYAKVTPDDIVIRISATNRGADTATLHILPTIWFRNTWRAYSDAARPELREVKGRTSTKAIHVSHAELGPHHLYIDGDVPLLFTENETNTRRLFNKPNATPFVKDAHPRVRRPRPDEGRESGADRHESRGASSRPHRSRRDGRAAAPVVGRQDAAGSLRRVRRDVRHARSGSG